MLNKIFLITLILFFNNNFLFSQENTDKEINITIKDTTEENNANLVVLQTINKITGKSYKYKVKINEEIKFERLIIKPLFCWKSSPSEIPENKVLLKITENKLDKTNEEIFFGWMFSSSTSISSLEHSMFDVIVVDCEII